MELLGAIKSYDWGSIGRNSKVALLALQNDANFAKTFDENSPYAELWMGDHVSGPSLLRKTREPLDAVLSTDKAAIGGMDKLPFLFKVLSITKPLSIQVHPNKAQAEQLHATRPDLYKDANHKPEISIALTDFSALCGFRQHDDLYNQLTKYAPLTNLIGQGNIEQLRKDSTDNSIKLCYTKLMHSPEDLIANCISELTDILNDNSDPDNETIAATFKHANHYFPNDVGVLSIFFLNILKMKPGQAIFLPANVPHAYLSGDCIECMACSDNVIRAGLTPKYKDVETLLEMLDYSGSRAEQRFFQPVDIGPYTKLFQPPVKDFAVTQISVPANIDSYAVENCPYGSILLILNGAAEVQTKGEKLFDVKEGSIFFLPSCIKDIGFKITSNDPEGFIAYQALYNDF